MSGHADALVEAIRLQRADRAPEAEAIYRAILDDEPAQPQALYLYGLLRLGTGRATQAADLLECAAALRPGDARVFLALGRARLSAGQPAAALAAAEIVLARQDAPAEAHFLRGTALNALARPNDAAAALARAVALDPAMAAARLNLANALMDLDRPAEAEALCRAALERDPELAEAWASLGFLLTGLGRLDAAMAACRAAIALRPDFAEAHWNLAVAALLAGDFELGFHEYEWRKRHDAFRRAFLDLPGPVWDGGDCAGRIVLVIAEQGLGDTLQFARYLPLIAARCGIPRLACDASLVPLLEGLPGLDIVVPRGGPLPDYDLWIDQMSLPRAFATRPDTIPEAGGYLDADPARAASWRRRLPQAPRVGVVWAGNPGHSNDRRRSLPYALLGRLLSVPGVNFVSLQHGPRADEAGLHGLEDHAPALRDYAETAALVSCLDLVVSVDTSVAHLAGALGRPVWVMLPHAPDWRWLLGRDDSPWYGSMRLFRQPAPGDWQAVIDRIAAALAHWRDAAAGSGAA